MVTLYDTKGKAGRFKRTVGGGEIMTIDVIKFFLQPACQTFTTFNKSD